MTSFGVVVKDGDALLAHVAVLVMIGFFLLAGVFDWISERDESDRSELATAICLFVSFGCVMAVALFVVVAVPW